MDNTDYQSGIMDYYNDVINNQQGLISFQKRYIEFLQKTKEYTINREVETASESDFIKTEADKITKSLSKEIDLSVIKNLSKETLIKLQDNIDGELNTRALIDSDVVIGGQGTYVAKDMKTGKNWKD